MKVLIGLFSVFVMLLLAVDSAMSQYMIDRGNDDAIYISIQAGPWQLVPGGGLTPSAPAFTSDSGLVYIVVRGMDNKIYGCTVDPTQMTHLITPWTPLGEGRTPSTPVGIEFLNGNLTITVVGMNNSRYQTTTDLLWNTNTPWVILPPIDFESDQAPVDMRDYWPDQYMVQKWRKHDGRLYVKRITKPWPFDPMGGWKTQPKLGEVFFSREDHFPYPRGSETTRFYDTWSMEKRLDGSVVESADSWTSEYCPDWCGGPGQIYLNGSGIIHGKPGGHVLGEGYYVGDVPLAGTPDMRTTAPSYTPGLKVYTYLRLEKKYNTFTPDFGRENGIWSEGNGKTYTNVILLVFLHGSNLPGSKDCDNRPVWFDDPDGYTSFLEYVWYAPGVGPIQEWVLFDERTCSGYWQPALDRTPINYTNYIDEDWSS